ncbi:hypothetical protein [Micromonospora sp. NPDC005161]
MTADEPRPPSRAVADLAEQLVPLAREFYARRPYVDEGYSYLLGGRETAQLDANAVSTYLVEPLILPAFFLAEDDDLGQARIARRRIDEPHYADPISRAEFFALVCDLLAALPDPPAASRLLAQAVADARAIAAFGCSGRPRRKVAKWVGHIVDNVLCAMEDEGEPDDVEVMWPATMRAAEANAKRADTIAARHAAKAAAVEQADAAAREFVAALSPGRHEVPQVWAGYVAATPAAERLGKHAFFALAREQLGDPRKVRGVRCWTVPAPAAAVDELLDRVAAQVWADRRGQTLDLIARHDSPEVIAA